MITQVMPQDLLGFARKIRASFDDRAPQPNPVRIGRVKPKDDRIWVTVRHEGDYDVETLFVGGLAFASRGVRHRFPERTQRWRLL
jgi:hypothetical protein